MLLKIPIGKVTTYGDIARAAGCPRGARAVGRILNVNPNPITVPCHRVVKSDGRIGGYAYGVRRKQDILRKEGIVCTDGRIKGFKDARVALL